MVISKVLEDAGFPARDQKGRLPHLPLPPVSKGRIV